MAYRLFDAEGRLSLNSRGLERDLKKAEGEVQSTVDRIDGMRGDAEIGADIRGLKRDLAKARKEVDDFARKKAEAQLDVDKAKFDAKMAAAQLKADELDGRVIDVTLEMHERRNAISQLGNYRKAVDDLDKQVRTVNSGGGFKRFGQNLVGWGKAADDAVNPLNKLRDTMENTRVTMGPISMTLGRMTAALTAFAPVVSGVVGSAAGLAGVLGHGLVGAAGVGGAALIGFGGLAAGVFAGIKKNSDVFKGVTKDVGHLGDVFGKLTRTGAKGFAKDIRSGLKDIGTLVPMFANQTNRAFGTLGEGVKGFARMLSSPEGAGRLKQIFSNANDALKPLMGGLTNLGQVGLRVFGSFSRKLEPMTQAFSKWTEGLLHGTENGKKLDGQVNELWKSLTAVGKTAGAGGRLLLSFFSAAAPAGRRMLGDITKLFNKWNEWLQDDGNRKKLTDFLDDSWSTTKKVASVVGDLLKGFHTLSEAARPTVDGLLDLAHGFGKLLGYLGKIPGAGAALQGLIGALVVARAAKLLGFLSKIVGLTGALRALGSLPIFGKFGKKGKGAGDVPIILPDGKDGGKAGKSWKSRFIGALKGGWETVALGTLIGLDKLKGAASRAAGGLAGAFRGALGKLKIGSLMGLESLGGFASKIGGALRGALGKIPLGGVLGKALGITGIAAEINQQIGLGLNKVGSMIQGDSTAAKIARFLISPKAFGDAMTTAWTWAKTKASQGAAAVGRSVSQQVAAAGRTAQDIGAGIGKLAGGAKTIAIKFAVTGLAAAKSAVSLAGRMAGKAVRYAIRFAVAAYAAARSAVNFGSRMAGKAVRFAIRFAVAALGAARSAYGFGRRMVGKAVRFAVRFAVAALQAAKSAYQFGKSMVGKAVRFSLSFAVSGLNAAKSAISWARSKFQGGGKSVSVNAGGHATGHRADGSGEGDPVSRDIEKRAFEAPRLNISRGGRALQPRYAVGEEPSSEFIIPTNPAYRGRALKLWKQAASWIGVPGFKKGLSASQKAAKEKREALARLKRKDVTWWNRHHFKSESQVKGPVGRVEDDVTKAENDYSLKNRKYGIDSDSHPTLNEDGSLNQANMAWHAQQIRQLQDQIVEVIRQYNLLMEQVQLAGRYLGGAIRKLEAWQPLSSWGGTKKGEKLGEYKPLHEEMNDQKASIKYTIADKWLDYDEWNQTATGIRNTKPTNTEGGSTPGDGTSFVEQAGAFNAARLALMGGGIGNALAPPGALGGGAPSGIGSYGAGGAGSMDAMTSTMRAGGASVPALMGTVSAGGGASQGTDPSQGGGMTQINNFDAPPPDAHTFTKALAWEAQHG